MDELDVTQLAEERRSDGEDARLKAILEAIVYVTDEPLSAQQIAAALERPIDVVKRMLDELVAEYARPEHGLASARWPVADGHQGRASRSGARVCEEADGSVKLCSPRLRRWR
jgi:hypothetical protein